MPARPGKRAISASSRRWRPAAGAGCGALAVTIRPKPSTAAKALHRTILMSFLLDGVHCRRPIRRSLRAKPKNPQHQRRHGEPQRERDEADVARPHGHGVLDHADVETG